MAKIAGQMTQVGSCFKGGGQAQDLTQDLTQELEDEDLEQMTQRVQE